MNPAFESDLMTVLQEYCDKDWAIIADNEESGKLYIRVSCQMKPEYNGDTDDQ